MHHRASVALTAFVTLVLVAGCKPVEDTRKIERPDGSTPLLDAGHLVEAFCEGTDAGCACYSNTCDRICGPGECQGLHIICPPGQDCLIRCDGEGACDDLFLDCESGDADCALGCSNGACARARYLCNDAIGENCCICVDGSNSFVCPRATGPTSCDAPAP